MHSFKHFQRSSLRSIILQYFYTLHFEIFALFFEVLFKAEALKNYTKQLQNNRSEVYFLTLYTESLQRYQSKLVKNKQIIIYI